jgi:hypothetical protein
MAGTRVGNVRHHEERKMIEKRNSSRKLTVVG